MTTEHPFIYIATLRRTGSKLLANAISQAPHAHIFRDTGLPRGNFNPSVEDRRLLTSLGLDADAMHRTLEEAPRRTRINVFRDTIAPTITEHLGQIGIWEFRNRRGERIIESFPDARVVVIARDPRDLYLELRERKRRIERAQQRNIADPEALVEYIRNEFAEQRTLIDQHQPLTVRHEDLCFNPHLVNHIRTFVKSAVPDESQPTRSAAKPRPQDTRRAESVGQWTRLTDDDERRCCDDIYDALEEYVRFWKYERDQPVAAPDPADATVETFTPFTGSRASAD